MAKANLPMNDAMSILLCDLPQFIVEPTRALFACQVTHMEHQRKLGYDSLVVGEAGFVVCEKYPFLGVSPYS